VKFLYDGFRCIEELNASDALVKEYIFGSLYLDELILQRTGATDYYFTHDYRYSVTSLTNTAGSIVESYDYKVYGERTCSGSGLTDIGYTSQRHDSETGLMYFKNRYYSTSMGQFVTRDPLGYVDGLSMYLGYFGADGVDPEGLLECSCSAGDGAKLKDITDKLNEEVSRIIGENIELKGVRNDLSTDLPDHAKFGLTKIDAWIEDLGDDYRKSNLIRASCIKLTCGGKTVVIGSDKISHFFQQGFMAYEIETKLGRGYGEAFSLFTEGLLDPQLAKGLHSNSMYFEGVRKHQKEELEKSIIPDSDEPSNMAKKWALNRHNAWEYFTGGNKVNLHGFGEKDLKTYYQKWGRIAGTNALAPSSLPDHFANMAGMKFWQKLSKAEDFSEFDFNICDYIDDIEKLIEK
jgi:RHS repeat-associated protein